MMQRIAAACVTCLISFTALQLRAEELSTATPPIQIGMTKSIFVDVPPVLIQIVTPTFNALTRECTGLNGHMVVGGDAFELCKRLEANELQFACFQGIEYAWVHERHPDIVPMMVAIYRHHHLRANLVVRKDSDVAGFQELRGKDLALPRKSKEHCRLFLERNCNDCGQCESKDFFNKVTRPMSMEGALDDVCAGRVQACIVDAVALENYTSIKPGCAARLRVAKQSETFPPAVICYRKGALPEETLAKFRSGMMNANKSEKTREMMNMYMISSFEPLPSDYFFTVSEILKTYPTPQ